MYDLNFHLKTNIESDVLLNGNNSCTLTVIFIFLFSGYSENIVTRPKHETAILDKRASFECSVKSPNAAEVEIWWQFQNKNVTDQVSDAHKVGNYDI